MNKWTTRLIQINENYTEEERRAIAFDIISYIVQRTRAGHGKGDKPWRTPEARKYSVDYKDSQDFKNAKGRQRKVDLFLSGEMLDSLDLLKSKKDGIVIGYDDGSPARDKAEGNILGSYGKKTNSKTAKSRDFLELSGQEVKDILSNYPLRGKDGQKAEDIRKERVKLFEAAVLEAQRLTEGKPESRSFKEKPDPSDPLHKGGLGAILRIIGQKDGE